MEFDREQEQMNAITHWIGLALGIVAVPILILAAYKSPISTNGEILGLILYGLGFLMVFAFSALYHHFSEGRLKNRLERWDHIGINFMIAGTYTPFVLAYANPASAWWLLSVIWGLAALGSVFNSIFPDKFRLLSVIIYVGMGLIIVLAPESFKSAIPSEQMQWIIAGAAVYIAGLIFYLWSFIYHHHALWHLFVLGGAICHYFGILGIFI
jgi:hemolysin III